MTNPEITELAEQINDNGFRWQEDGNTILQIIDLLDAPLQSLPMDLVERKDAVKGCLANLNDVHGWDAPRMSEAQENAFFSMMVEWRIK